jgi:hypothetical protein
VDRVAVLCEKDRDLLHRFSQQSLNRAEKSTLLLTALPFFSGYLEANVKKEIDKDRLIIETASKEYAAGKEACELDLEEIFERTKSVDRAFMDTLFIPTLSFHVRYSDFADIRIQRIWLIAKTVYGLLKHWPDTASFPEAVRAAYSEPDFRERLADILHLYNEETRILSKSIRLFGPLNKTVNSFADAMYQAMEDITGDISARSANIIYGDQTVHA